MPVSQSQKVPAGAARRRHEAELMALDEKLMLMEQQIEDARTRMMNGMNESCFHPRARTSALRPC